MVQNQQLLEKLEQMLKWKKSRKFYAEKLNITESQVDELIADLKKSEQTRESAEIGTYIGALEEKIISLEEDLKNGTGTLTLKSKDEIKTLDELIQKCNIDIEKWEITKYIQNYWGNVENPYWQVKAWMSLKRDSVTFQESFIKFLENYKPVYSSTEKYKNEGVKSNACLIINKQDAHLNKFDESGDNDIYSRFLNIEYQTRIILQQANLSNRIENVTYIIGSDEFNSEFTNATTKGTPQKNIMSYHESFEQICQHEIVMIELMLKNSKSVNVVYVPGNHDEFVGWHMINWLSTYFRNESNIKFDTTPEYRKYVSYGTTLMMFNHGDAIKPSKLAGMFPIECKEEWSNHDNFYIFTGDKHHELSHDFNGIKFYQIPAFSSSKSNWDEKQGHTCSKGELTAFMIDYIHGMTNIFKRPL